MYSNVPSSLIATIVYPIQTQMKPQDSNVATAVARVMVIALVLMLLTQWVQMVTNTTKQEMSKYSEQPRTVVTYPKPAAVEKDSHAERNDVDDGDVENVAILTPTPLDSLGAKCTCPSSCVLAACESRQSTDDEDDEVELKVQFVRCSACRVEKASGRCVGAHSSQLLSCSHPLELQLIDTVRRCLSANPVVAPKVFTVGPDSSEFSRGAPAAMTIVCDNGNVNLCANKASALEAKVLAEAARFSQARDGAASKPPVQLVDFGVSDSALDSRFLSSVENSTAKLYSLRHDSYAISKLQQCITRGNRIEVSKDYSLESGEAIGTTFDGFTFFRLHAPGYEDKLVKMLTSTFAVKRPTMITTHTPRGDATSLLSSFLLKQDYIAYQPSTCLEISRAEDLVNLREWHRSSPKARPEGVLAWVERATPDVFRPLCETACVETTCIDNWRTQYNKCAPEEKCGPSMGGSCDWNVTQQACRADGNWPSVLSCTEPRIPMPSWFSIVAAFNLLFACRGARDCPREVDVPVVKRRLQELVAMGSSVNEGIGSHVVDVGSGTGLVPVSAAVDSPETTFHIVEARPSNKQLAHISACNAKLKNIRIVDPEQTAVGLRPLDTLLRDWQTSPKMEKERTAKRVPVVMHIAAPDPTTVIEGANNWLSSEKWRPTAIMFSVPRSGKYFSDPSLVWNRLVNASYVAKRLVIEQQVLPAAGQSTRRRAAAAPVGPERSVGFSPLATAASFSELFKFDPDTPPYREPPELDEKHFEDTSIIVQFTLPDV